MCTNDRGNGVRQLVRIVQRANEFADAKKHVEPVLGAYLFDGPNAYEFSSMPPEERIARAAELEDVTRADFFAVTAPGPAFSLGNTADFRVAWSRATADAAIARADNKIL